MEGKGGERRIRVREQETRTRQQMVIIRGARTPSDPYQATIQEACARARVFDASENLRETTGRFSYFVLPPFPSLSS